MLKLICLILLVGNAVSDSINFVDYGGKIPTEGYFDVFVNYDADKSRDLSIKLKKASDLGKEYAAKEVSIDTGKNIKRGVSVRLERGVQPGNDYVLQVSLKSGLIFQDKEDEKIINVSVRVGRQGFHVDNGVLYDANNNEFMVRGIANAHADYDTGNRWYARDALTNIAYSKANTVRIQWRKSGSLTTRDLDTVLGRAVQAKLIPLLELHDVKGSNDDKKLKESARWFADNIQLLVKYKKYLLINLASEWGNTVSNKYWKDSFKDAIDIIRDAGYSGTLVIDTTGEGQNPSAIKEYAKRLLDHDKFENIVYGLHMKSDWSSRVNKYQIATELQKMKSDRVPLLISSFADRYPAKINGICVEVQIDAMKIMTEALRYRIGYVGPYWAGNGNYQNCGSLSYLDTVPNYVWNTFNSYSRWGNTLINTLNVGIRDSSRMASVFV